MSKRAAETQLTKVDYEAEENKLDEEGAGEDDMNADASSWKEASADKLKDRKILKVRRNDSSSSSSTPAAVFNFSAPPPASANAAAEKDKDKKAQIVNGHATENNGSAAVNTTAPNNKLQAFLAAAAQNIECSVCLVSYPKSKAKCPACETPNPDAPQSATQEKAEPSAYTFGAAPNAASASSKSSSSTSSSTSLSTINFGLPPSSSASSSSSSSASSSSADTYSFGQHSASPFTFQFGESNAPFAFSSNAAMSFNSVVSSSSSLSSSSSGFGKSGSIPISSSAPQQTSSESTSLFKDAKAESSGEEGDKILYRVKAKLYQLKYVEKPVDDDEGDNQKENGKKKKKGGADEEDDSDTRPKETKKTKTEPGYVTVGEGEAHVNTFEHESKLKGRLVMRTEKTHRLILNAPVYAQHLMPTVQGDRYARFHSVDLDGKPAIFLLKVASKADAEKTVEAMKKCAEAISK